MLSLEPTGAGPAREENAPIKEPIKVSVTSKGSRLRLISGPRRDGTVPPILINFRANVFMVSAYETKAPRER
jgi:hypothetical protein